ncbi:MAG TPA: ferric reductase-like transmembrane domain-containing protein [Acidimicrobiales bacterium]|jgi:predicted ferric reductase|nr:ferric reductase-like transmembrane domain-containing protein [Acidimicrobiales bacterium]
MLATSSTTLWYSTRATGIVALVLLTATMVLGILTAGRLRTRSWPAFAQADLHKRVSVLAMVFLGIHVVTAVLDTYVNIGWASIVVPFASSYQPFWTGLGAVGLDLLVAVAVSSAWRGHISARAWRTIHWLAYGSWPVAMAHSLGEGTDGPTVWMGILAGVCGLAVAGTLSWRVLDYRRHGRRAGQVGALTRVVSPPPARPASPGRPDGRRVRSHGVTRVHEVSR